MKVYLYSRVSTERQSLEQQEKTAYDWLNMHHLSVDEVVSDEGISGGVSYTDRNLGRILIPKLQRGDLLIVSEISRLSRSMYDLSKLINTDLKRIGIRLVVVSMNIDLHCDKMTAIDELILNNFAFAAQLEKELIRGRTISSLQVKRSQGIKSGRANSNYKINKERQAEGHLSTTRTKITNTVKSPEFQSFCRILKRSYPELQGIADSDISALEHYKDALIRKTDADRLDSIICQMRDAQADNKDLFKRYDLNDTKIKPLIRSRIHSTFRTIENYNKLKRNSE